MSDKCTGTQGDKCTDTQDTDECTDTRSSRRRRAVREAIPGDRQGLWPLAREAPGSEAGTRGQTRPLAQRLEKASETENREGRWHRE